MHNCCSFKKIYLQSSGWANFPYRNYEYIQAQAPLSPLHEFEDGYSLYVIHKQNR